MGSPSRLFSVGTVSYNGYTFPASLRATAQCRFIYDRADRVVKYVQYDIKVETTILPEDAPTLDATSTTDENLENLRTRLSSPGKKLVFTAQGLGNDLTINDTDGSGIHDVAFGPKPQMLVWEPIGSSRACRVSWQVTTCIPECSAPSYKNVPIAFTYGIEFALDESGMTQRTIAGELEIAMTRMANTNAIPDIADAYRDLISVPTIPGFLRTQNFEISEDKRTLTFTLVDTEIASDNPFDSGILTMEATHQTSSGLGSGGFAVWNSSLSATIELAPGWPRNLPWNMFQSLVEDRLPAVRLGGVLPGPKQQHGLKGKKVDKPIKFFPVSFTASESIYGRSFSFSLDYRVDNTTTGQFETQKFFKLLAGKSWINHDLGLLAQRVGAQGNRGYRGLGVQNDKDQLLDACNTLYIPIGKSDTLSHVAEGQSAYYSLKYPETVEEGTLYYDNEYEVDEGSQLYQHRPLKPLPPSSMIDEYQAGDKLEEANGLPHSDSTAVAAVQTTGSSSYSLRVTGKAVVLGYGVKPPSTMQWGDRNLYRKKSKIRTKVLVPGPVPIVGTAWDVVYAMAEAPSVGDPLKVIVTNGEANANS